MDHVYSGFDRPVSISPPLAVALRLVLDELEEARRVLERGEPGGRVARAARGGRSRRAAAIVPAAPTRPPSANERRRARCREAPLLVVHATIVRCGSRRSATCSWT